MRASIKITALTLLTASIPTALGASINHLVPKSTADIPRGNRHAGYVAARLRKDARALVSGHEMYHARNVAPSPSAVAVGIQPSTAANPIVDPASWTSQTVEACTKAVEGMNGVASNPSGMAACYNVRQLDSPTGVFEADVRLYRVAQPTEGWTTQDITVGMSYLGAAVALERSGNSKRDGTLVSFLHEKRDTALPQSVKNLTFAGKVNDDLMGWLKNQYALLMWILHAPPDADKMTRSMSRTLLTPQIAISGKAENGSAVTTQLSTDSSSFLSGLFSDQTIANSTAAAAASADSAANGAFVLPGTKMGIFPVGLIITGVWTLLFVAVVGLGTVGRINFRDQYRRRIKAQQARQFRTI